VRRVFFKKGDARRGHFGRLYWDLLGDAFSRFLVFAFLPPDSLSHDAVERFKCCGYRIVHIVFCLLDENMLPACFELNGAFVESVARAGLRAKYLELNLCSHHTSLSVPVNSPHPLLDGSGESFARGHIEKANLVLHLL